MAAILSLFPGGGYFYLGMKRQGLILLAASIVSGLGMTILPVVISPGNFRSIILGPMLYALFVLPVCVVYGMVGAYLRAAGLETEDAEAAARTAGTLGSCLILAGAGGYVWTYWRSGYGFLVAWAAPLILLAVGARLVGATSDRGKIAPPWLTALAAGFPASRLLAFAAVAGCLLSSVRVPMRWLSDLWWLAPLVVGYETLHYLRRARERRSVASVDRIALLLAVAAVMFGVVAAPVRQMATDFPFTSARALPNIFNLAYGKHRLIHWAESTAYVPEVIGLKYTYQGYGNVKVVGDPNVSCVRDRSRTVIRAESDAAAEALLYDDGTVVGSDGAGTVYYTNYKDVPPGEGTSRDILFTVPANAAVTIDIHFGQVQVVGVKGGVTVKTGFGTVDVIDCQGDIDVTTEWGDVRIENATGKVKALTEFGTVSCTVATLTGACDLRTEIGKVRCTLPAAASASVTAQTKQGSIGANFALNRTAQLRSQSATATIGQGEFAIQLDTGFGDISVRTRRD